MDTFLILRDSDIFENPLPEPKEYVARPTAKGVVLDGEGNVAILSVGDHIGLPGGGVESGETYKEAFIRECDEEIGCKVKILSTIGKAEQYRARDAQKYELVYFVAQVIGEKGKPSSQQVDEQDIEVLWLSSKKVLEMFEKQIHNIPEDKYVRQFNLRTHLAAFKKFLEHNK